MTATEDLAARINGTNQPSDLPDGVSPWLGPEADAVALGHIVQTLPDDEWERAHGVILPDWCSTPNAHAIGYTLYLLRRKPQTVTVELPKDVAHRFGHEENVGSPQPTDDDRRVLHEACKEATSNPACRQAVQ